MPETAKDANEVTGRNNSVTAGAENDALGHVFKGT
jgi:hypothetical protein